MAVASPITWLSPRQSVVSQTVQDLAGILLPAAFQGLGDGVEGHPGLGTQVTHYAVADAVPTDLAVPIQAPAAAPNDLIADPVPALLRLAARHVGQTLTVRFIRAGCTLHLHDDDGVVVVATVPDLDISER
ncbi:hypothetical protein SAMN05216284_102178 [Micromonospora sediminimaris]|uniref:Uncharacterized protein n=2 Tax=Micromonospora sediminimaris TaxID=547162 RepID=A0A9W5XLN7_9ACTN|nr:hypothetical protein Vse01_48840 [Micromonospora sediminimaris]SFC00257.1 hypothetical protein SAMN05216284_102178 [Micromonospora sediminimaris]